MRDLSESNLVRNAREAGHPNPEKATWGEVNVLRIASLREGRLPNREEAQSYLDYCERISDFNDTMNGGSRY